MKFPIHLHTARAIARHLAVMLAAAAKMLRAWNPAMVMTGAACFVCPSADGHADTGKSRSAEAKSAALKEALSQRPLRLDERTSPKARGFCSALYSAMANGKVTHVDPVHTTNDPNDSSLSRYAACRTYGGEIGLSTFDHVTSIGTHDIRIYRLPSQGDPSNGYREYVYGEDPNNSRKPLAQYAHVDASNCTFRDVVSVTPQNSTRAQLNERGLNGVVRFNRRFLIYSHSDFGHLQVWQYNSKKAEFDSQSLCIWTAK